MTVRATGRGQALLGQGTPTEVLDEVVERARRGLGSVVVGSLSPQARQVVSQQLDRARATGWLEPASLVVFSSGSTGVPRGIVRTLDSWQLSIPAFSRLSGIDARDVVWLPGPITASLFLFGGYHARLIGARVICLGQDPSTASVAHCVPTQLPALLAEHAAGRLPRLHTLIVAGDRVPTALVEQAVAARLRVVEYYGAAELSFVAAGVNAAGLRAFEGVELELREGQIWSRSPYQARGYLDPAAGGPLQRDQAGWATVADLGELTDGVLTVRGRGDSAITVGGHTVLADDVEQALVALPGIRAAAVVGIEHRRLGQLLVAAVCSDRTVPELRAAAGDLPAPSRPRRWVHLAELPLTPSGKLDRAQVRRLVMAAVADSLPPRTAPGVNGSEPANSRGSADPTPAKSQGPHWPGMDSRGVPTNRHDNRRDDRQGQR